VKALPVTSCGARRPGGRLPSVPVWAVYATGLKPPQGGEPIEGLFLTGVPVEDFSAACLGMQGYRAGWEIELFPRVLQQGCQIERVRLATPHRLLKAPAISLIIAWRIPTITVMGRAYPDAPCERGFAPREGQTTYTRQYHQRPPAPPPPLRDTVRT
jgi:hypothetical protein